MKANIFFIFISIFLTSLISYSVYSYSMKDTKILSTIISSITFITYISGLLGLKLEYGKSQILKTNVSIVYLIINIFITMIFLKLNYSNPIYILLNGFFVLTYVSFLYFFSKNKF